MSLHDYMAHCGAIVVNTYAYYGAVAMAFSRSLGG